MTDFYYWYFSALVQAMASMVAVVGMFAVYLLQGYREKWKIHVDALMKKSENPDGNVTYFGRKDSIKEFMNWVKQEVERIPLIESTLSKFKDPDSQKELWTLTSFKQYLTDIENQESRISKTKTQAKTAIMWQFYTILVNGLGLLTVPFLQATLWLGLPVVAVSIGTLSRALNLTYKFVVDSFDNDD